MAGPPRDDTHRRSRALPIALVALTAIGAAKAAAWFHFRKAQPVTDELTRERLQPRSDT